MSHEIKLSKEDQTTEIERRIHWAAYRELSFILKNAEVFINLKRKVYDICILPVMSYSLETMILTIKSTNKLKITQKAIERAMLGISLRDRIHNEEIRRRSKVRDVIQNVAEAK